jgi:creatinine amidohydrolase
MKLKRLQELKWPEVKNYLENDQRIILPIGSTEQHSYWLPLGTDSMVSISLAEEAAKKTGVLVAPPIWMGWSPHHMALPGTISIRPEILIELLFDEIKSLHKHGFKQFILLNGHRIVNVVWMQIAAQKAQQELKIKTVIFDPAYMSKEIADELGFGPVGHAEESEGSHMLYIHPELADLSKATDYSPKGNNLYHIDPRYPSDTLNYVPSTIEQTKKVAEISGGTVGNATQSDKEKGKRYHDHLVKRLVEVLNGIRQ